MFALPDGHTSVAKAFYGWETAGDIIERSESGGNSAQRPTKWVHVGHSLGTGGIENVSRTGTGKISLADAALQLAVFVSM